MYVPLRLVLEHQGRLNAPPPRNGNTSGTKKEQLPKCLRDFLRSFFPNVQLGHFKTISPVDDARFVASSLVGLVATAMTTGLYDIQYKPADGITGLDLTGGKDGSSIGIIAEEIMHAVQFVRVWDKVEEHLGANRSYNRARAVSTLYLGESARILAKLTAIGISHDVAKELAYWANQFEVEAHQKRRAVERAFSESGGKNPRF